MANDIAKKAAFGFKHFQTPSPFGRQVDHVFQCGFGWGGQAVFQIFMPLTQNLQIKRDDKC